MKWLALAIVGAVLFLLVLGAIARTLRDGSGLDPGVASAMFALLGAMVAGSLGASAINKNDKNDKGTSDE